MGCTASSTNPSRGTSSSPRSSSSYTGPPQSWLGKSLGLGKDHTFDQLTSCLEAASTKLRNDTGCGSETEKALLAMLPLLVRYFQQVAQASKEESTPSNPNDHRQSILWRGECTLVLRELKYLRDLLKMRGETGLAQKPVPQSLACCDAIAQLRLIAGKDSQTKLLLGDVLDFISLSLEHHLLCQQPQSVNTANNSNNTSNTTNSSTTGSVCSRVLPPAIATDGLDAICKPAPVSPSLFIDRDVGMVPLKSAEVVAVPPLQLWAAEEDVIQIPRSKRPSSTACSSVSSDSPGRLTVPSIHSLSPRTPPRFDQEFHVADVLRERRRHSDSAQYALKIHQQHHSHHYQHQHSHHQQIGAAKSPPLNSQSHSQPSTPTKPVVVLAAVAAHGAVDQDLARQDGGPDSGNKRWRSKSEGDSRGVVTPRLKSMHSRSSSCSFYNNRNSCEQLPGIDLGLNRSNSSHGSTKALFLDREWTQPDLAGYDSDDTVSDFGFFDIEGAH